MKLKNEKVICKIISSPFFVLFSFFIPFGFLVVAFSEATVYGNNNLIIFGFLPVAFFYIGGFMWFIGELGSWRKSIRKRENLEKEYLKNMKELPLNYDINIVTKRRRDFLYMVGKPKNRCNSTYSSGDIGIIQCHLRKRHDGDHRWFSWFFKPHMVEWSDSESRKL